mmetsp:Transcript_78797/g.96353  ORF Transcript_78797/g.96353 Transcript_78797/m.96353 type:complete len:335 (-) Transcript_78797:41-1045(-)
MPSDTEELFWALVDQNNVEQLKRIVPSDFNWNILHPRTKFSILVQACEFPLGRREEEILDMIEWLVKSGASVSQKCGKSSLKRSMCMKGDPQGTKLAVGCSEMSIMSYIEAWKHNFKNNKNWEDFSNFLKKVVERIARASSAKQTRPRTSIDEGIVEIWEKYLQATSSHDLTIQASDGRVTCHAQMLIESSPVVQAMLGSAMKEKKTRQIQLEDTSSSAVQLFLEVLYTCSSQSDPIHWETALSALDLAHRWQVDVVVAILAALLQDMVAEDSFSAIAEQAALKGLDSLMQECKRFATRSWKIQDQIKNGELPAVVQRLFQADPPKAVKKRKRL